MGSVVLVYDAQTREFPCWFEGPLPDKIPDDLCKSENQKYHPVRDGVYFYRGQTVLLLLKGGVIADLFSLGLQVNNITEPTTPVFGAGVTIPTVSALVPSPVIVGGSGVTAGATLAAVNKDYLDLLNVVDH